MYLVEHYRPGLSAEGLRNAADLLRRVAGAMASEGSDVRYVRATIVPSDEAMLALFEAGSESIVRDAYARAGIACERITVAVSA